MSVKVNSRTKEAVSKIRKLSINGIKEFSDVAVENAKRNSPYDTGNNRDLIDKDFNTGTARIFSQSGYGAHLELGTSRQQAQPYFAPAINETIREFNDGKKWS